VSAQSSRPDAAAVRRLNWGCGPSPAPGWTNSDRSSARGVDLPCDIRDGLPVADDSFDYAVSIHALQAITYLEVVGVLRELRRVLRADGVLRLAVPDLDRAIEAYRRGDHAYFEVPDDEVRSLGGKLSVQMTWYGHSHLLLTYDFLEELLQRAGFRDVRRCAFGETGSAYPEITQLDDRERETLFVEARK